MNDLKEMSIEDLLEELVQQGRHKQLYSLFNNVEFYSENNIGKNIDENIELIKKEITTRFYNGSKFTCALN